MKRTPFLFVSGTPMAERHRSFPWESTPLGAPLNWDSALKTLVPIMLGSNQPMFIVWGEARTLLYNDAYAEILADKDADALGQDFLDVWHEIRESLAEIVAAAYRGEPVQMDDIELWMERRGFREEAHFSFFYSPVRADTGEIGGFFCACNEITAQVLTERRLAESEARHRGVLENMEEGFTLFDRDFTILQVNEATTRLVNLSRDELVGHNHWELFPGTEHGSVGHMYRAVLAEKRPHSLEHLYKFPDGRERWYEVRAFPVGEGLASVFQDVTERRRLQQEVTGSLERIQLALDAGAIIGTWVWNIAENRFVADERFAAGFGLDAQTLKAGAPLEYAFDAIHPEDLPRVRDAINSAVQRSDGYRCQYRVRRNGEYRWVEASGRVQADELGRPVRFPGVLLDIDERRRAETERDRASTLLETFIEAVPGAVYAKDRQGRYLVANRGVAEAFGRPFPDILGRSDADVLPDRAQAGAVMALDFKVMESGRTHRAEELVTRADGTPSTWWSTKEPLRDPDGTVVGLVGTSVEITERKRLEEELRVADRRKDEFLAMLAHELRNPLAPINTSAHVISLSAGDPERVKAASHVIARQVGHLTRLVDDLLDVSRVTRGLVQVAREPVDLQSVIATAVEQVRPLVQSRRHELRTRMGVGPFTVKGDFHRLVQVVTNLLNNSAKYTPQGGLIEVGLSIESDQATLRVTDNGIGIAPEMLDHVFDLFTQAERTPDRSQGGLGIGLALVKSLVQLHDGQVEAQSDGLHKGSTFCIRLPLAPEAQQRASDPVVRRTNVSSRILVVDDNTDAAATLAQMLEIIGHTVDVAHDARSALELASRQSGWDTFILDIGLPDMTGYELAQKLRETSAGRDAMFVALTGYGQPHDRVMSKQAGFDYHLVKPADIPQIIDILSRAPVKSRH